MNKLFHLDIVPGGSEPNMYRFCISSRDFVIFGIDISRDGYATTLCLNFFNVCVDLSFGDIEGMLSQ